MLLNITNKKQLPENQMNRPYVRVNAYATLTRV